MVCFFQRLIEWYELWRDHLDAYLEGEAWELQNRVHVPIARSGHATDIAERPPGQIRDRLDTARHARPDQRHEMQGVSALAPPSARSERRRGMGEAKNPHRFVTVGSSGEGFLTIETNFLSGAPIGESEEATRLCPRRPSECAVLVLERLAVTDPRDATIATLTAALEEARGALEPFDNFAGKAEAFIEEAARNGTSALMPTSAIFVLADSAAPASPSQPSTLRSGGLRDEPFHARQIRRRRY